MAEENKEIVIVDDKTIQEKIYFIRGQKVMLDSDLAEIYGYETKMFNRQVKRNIEKFEGDDFMFQLTDEEVYELSRCHFGTLNNGQGRGSNIKYKPYAFTEQGIYMLMTVLRGELAIRQSRALIRMFKQMKDYIVENRDFLSSKEMVQLLLQTNKNTNDIMQHSKEIAKLDDKISTLATKEDLKKVMLDADLAEIYGYETKNFNRQVKNNIEKFEGEDFMFQLTENEFENLRCKNFTSSWGGSRYLPNAFTEQGIYMLMTVLRGELAIRQSRALIRTFKQMKDFIIENQDFIGSKELVQIAIQTNKNTNDIAKINDKISTLATKEDLKKVMDNFIDPDTYKHFLLMNGDKIEADVAYTKIYKSAKKSIYVIDNYIGLKTLELLRAAKDNVEVVIFSDNVKNKDMITKNILNDFRRDYHNINLKIKIAGKRYHDRYIGIDYGTEDEAFYLCGASSKDAGNKISSITKIEESSKDMYHTMFGRMLDNKNLKI